MPPQLAEIPAEWTDMPYYVVVPGAADSGRRWPPEKFAAALTALLVSGRGIICGGLEERDTAAALMAAAKGNWLDMTGKTTLPQLIELIRQARLVLSNDTGAAHIAARCGIPAVVILGGGQWGRFFPYPSSAAVAKPYTADHRMDCFKCNWRCVQKHQPDTPYPCVANVEVSAVTKELVTAMMSRRG